jgi:protein O-mannosyl-transferase
MDEAMRQRVLIAIGLVAAVAWVYLPVRNYPLISYNDPLYVSDPHVQAGLTISNVGWAMTTFAAANWHPVTWLSLMLERTLYGDKSGAFHLTNVAVHAINAVLLFVLFVVMTQATWRSAIVAALFALHPMRVGSVAWVSERKGLLAVMVTLLCLLAYVRPVRAKDGRHGGMAVVMITAASRW